jgi:hypothetical protein
MTLDLNKTVQTKCGYPVRILCTDRLSVYPIVGLVEEKNGIESLCTWDEYGETPSRSMSMQLINVPVKKEGWVNIYKPWQLYSVANCCAVWPSKEAAKANATNNAGILSTNYINTIKIEWEE